MEQYLQAAAAALVAVILILLLNRGNPDLGMLVTIGACCLICCAAGVFLEPVVEFLRELGKIGRLDSGLVTILFQCTGIGFLSELTGLICSDAGESSLGKALQFLSSGVILFLSLPLLRELIAILEEVLMQI